MLNNELLYHFMNVFADSKYIADHSNFSDYSTIDDIGSSTPCAFLSFTNIRNVNAQF